LFGVACYRRLLILSFVAIAVPSFAAIVVLSFVACNRCSLIHSLLSSIVRRYRHSFVCSAPCLSGSTSITEALHTTTTAPPVEEVGSEENMMERNALVLFECFARSMLAELRNVLVPLVIPF
jgi:hypothetical protein